MKICFGDDQGYEIGQNGQQVNDVEGALENIVTLNMANSVTSREARWLDGSTEVIQASDQVILSLAYLCI